MNQHYLFQHYKPQRCHRVRENQSSKVHHIKVPTPPKAILGSSQGWFFDGRDSQANVGKEEENVKGAVSLKK